MRARFPVAVHIFLLREHHVLLLRRANTGYEVWELQRRRWPSGWGRESVTHAAIREAYEEVGVHLCPTGLTVVGVMHRLSHEERVDFFLVASRWSGTLANQEPAKCAERRWCALDALPANTIPYVRAALENFCQGVRFAEFGWLTAAS